MWLVLTHTADESGLWAYSRLRARSRGETRIVLLEELDLASTTWEHGVGRQGTRTCVHLADGRRVEAGGGGAVLNRLPRAPWALLTTGPPGEAAYATSELHAFAMSWLRSLAPVVVNAPTAQGLSGRWRSALHWRALAVQAGLPVVPLHLSSTEPAPLDDAGPSAVVLAVGGEIVGAPAPPAVRCAVRRLAALADTAILGLRFSGAVPASGGWRLLDATPQPDLRSGGESGIAALEALAR
ncbi:hypothetical protein [Blastococcus sp. VKM Ac-2987]|uniref:hypothetical protein n=1 Tax=Blastococcus sp. VKM Ac-2987 TaxID=3004141 RepID=UPI0022AB7E0F|nr:hypothetical protein [Blastococcus sp. VKM Ac-2987]MCZ2860708.1 hypothetical protein [Blastococcus sp. VKM Ac-2987]